VAPLGLAMESPQIVLFQCGFSLFQATLSRPSGRFFIPVGLVCCAVQQVLNARTPDSRPSWYHALPSTWKEFPSRHFTLAPPAYTMGRTSIDNGHRPPCPPSNLRTTALLAIRRACQLRSTKPARQSLGHQRPSSRPAGKSLQGRRIWFAQSFPLSEVHFLLRSSSLSAGRPFNIITAREIFDCSSRLQRRFSPGSRRRNNFHVQFPGASFGLPTGFLPHQSQTAPSFCSPAAPPFGCATLWPRTLSTSTGSFSLRFPPSPRGFSFGEPLPSSFSIADAGQPIPNRTNVLPAVNHACDPHGWSVLGRGAQPNRPPLPNAPPFPGSP